MNTTESKVVNSMFKNYKPFFINIVLTEIYRFKFVHVLPIFGLKNCGQVSERPQTEYS